MSERSHNHAMSAAFSPCRTWRYVLDRNWNARRPVLLVVMLNPSTADEEQDDPTIRRVRGFAEAWDYGGFRVLNLFAFRATKPRELRVAADPVGPENDERLAANLLAWRDRGRPALAAWGGHGNLRGRAFKVAHLVDGVQWVCLGTNDDGTPKHPLFVGAATQPIPFRGPR